jgi:hypothetical protein
LIFLIIFTLYYLIFFTIIFNFIVTFSFNFIIFNINWLIFDLLLIIFFILYYHFNSLIFFTIINKWNLFNKMILLKSSIILLINKWFNLISNFRISKNYVLWYIFCYLKLFNWIFFLNRWKWIFPMIKYFRWWYFSYIFFLRRLSKNFWSWYLKFTMILFKYFLFLTHRIFSTNFQSRWSYASILITLVITQIKIYFYFIFIHFKFINKNILLL